MDIIEEASRDAGFTLEEIRAKRHGFDHTVMAPRPDQLERMKRLGMVPGRVRPKVLSKRHWGLSMYSPNTKRLTGIKFCWFNS